MIKKCKSCGKRRVIVEAGLCKQCSDDYDKQAIREAITAPEREWYADRAGHNALWRPGDE